MSACFRPLVAALVGAGILGAAAPALASPNPLRDAYFGETHVHTSWSFDAYIFGNHITGPADAYDYAKGKTIMHPLGYPIKITTPLDWMGVTDHSEYSGVVRGDGRMRWVDSHYLSDTNRTTQELEAVLLALSVQGGANDAVLRSRIIDSYRIFMMVHKPLAGYVAQDLAAWNYWDATPQYLALLKSDAIYPASRYAILSYLKASPRADAKAAVKSLAAEYR